MSEEHDDQEPITIGVELSKAAIVVMGTVTMMVNRVVRWLDKGLTR